MADRVAARMTALRPGASPPPVEIAIRKGTVRGGKGSTEMGGNQPNHFSGLRMPAERLLGKHDRVIHGHFKHTAARGSQSDLRLRPTIPQRGRQTDGPGLVISDGAEFDVQTHGEERGAKSEGKERRASSE